MTLDTLWGFQKAVYRCLASNKNLTNNVSGIYYQVPQDTKFPYIHLEINKFYNYSPTNYQGFKLHLNIQILSREATTQGLFKLAGNTEQSLQKLKDELKEYHYVAAQFYKGDIKQHTDGITQILVLRFIITLRRRLK